MQSFMKAREDTNGLAIRWKIPLAPVCQLCKLDTDVTVDSNLLVACNRVFLSAMSNNFDSA